MSAEPMLDEIEVAARALDTARQAYGAAMMRAFVHVENERYEATRKVADMSHTIMLRDETIATLTRERDEARADLARSVAAWESAGMHGRTAHDAMLALAKERAEAFRRGAEAMREACADEVGSYTAWSEPPSLEFLERQVRALPTPEEP